MFGGTIRKVDIVLGDDELSEADRQHINELKAKITRAEGGHDNFFYKIRICVHLLLLGRTALGPAAT